MLFLIIGTGYMFVKFKKMNTCFNIIEEINPIDLFYSCLKKKTKNTILSVTERIVFHVPLIIQLHF